MEIEKPLKIAFPILDCITQFQNYSSIYYKTTTKILHEVCYNFYVKYFSFTQNRNVRGPAQGENLFFSWSRELII